MRTNFLLLALILGLAINSAIAADYNYDLSLAAGDGNGGADLTDVTHAETLIANFSCSGSTVEITGAVIEEALNTVVVTDSKVETINVDLSGCTFASTPAAGSALAGDVLGVATAFNLIAKDT
eukprot:TRINITY_DN3923_c0_g2_i1.p1 TRINITY_DN3923_c0_g2~~TRINITY_DN3923_c0_g2_i1.p1  ORF type:complete len:123 (-),score=4.93 TRINITY_DN3923_c0_g2_i1:543-911(-)